MAPRSSIPSSKILRRVPLEQLDADVEARLVDLCIDVRRETTDERLFFVGGRWDRTEDRYVEDARFCKTLYVKEAQLEVALATWAWIQARRSKSPRPIIIMADGARGSGKTHWCVLALFIIGVAFPKARCWVVNPANTRREEVQIIVEENIPSEWRAWSEHHLQWTMPNGSTVQNVSGELPENVGQGGVEALVLNEAQDMQKAVYTRAMGAVRNVRQRPRGVMFIACNPAQRRKGEWTDDVAEGIRCTAINGQHFLLDPKKNSALEEGTLDEIEAAIRYVDPRAADADSRGIRRRLTDLACPAFRPWPSDRKVRIEDGREVEGHIGAPPDLGWADATVELTAKKTRTKGYPQAGGTDFQGRPYCVTVIGKYYRIVGGPLAGKIGYYLTDVVTGNGHEEGLSDRLYDRQYSNQALVLVADTSGHYQDVERHHDGQRSHQKLRDCGWHVEAPVEPRHPEKSKYGVGRNPIVEESLAQLYEVMDEGRLRVDPSQRCAWIVESLKKCRVNRRGAKQVIDNRDEYGHTIDCIRYFIWWVEPAPGPGYVVPSRTSGRQVLGRRV